MPAISTARTKDEAVHIMTWHDVGVIWIKGAATVDNQRETETLMIDALGKRANRYGAFVIINGDFPPPTYQVRQELDVIYERIAHRLQGVAYAILGDGFQTAVIRAAIVGSNWLSRRPYPTSVSGDIRKGANWLYYTMPKDPERGDIGDFVNAVQAMMRGEAPETLRGKQQG